MRTSSFLTSTSGYVSTPEGASLGWMAGVIAGTAVFLGTPQVAGADACGGMPPGQCGNWQSCNSLCQVSPPLYWHTRLCRATDGVCVEQNFCECT